MEQSTERPPADDSMTQLNFDKNGCAAALFDKVINHRDNEAARERN